MLTAGGLDSLNAYKNSNHLLFIGFLVGDGNDPAASTNLLNVPDSVDIVELFSGYDNDSTHWRALQAKGTKIVRCEFPSSAYFDHSVKDPATLAPGYVRPPGINPNTPTSTSTYEHYARDKYVQYITQNKWDGIDIDIESGTFGGDVPASNAKTFLLAIAKYFGPNCTSCTVLPGGKKPMFLYDTDVSSSSGNLGYSNIYTPYKSNYDYALFQAYTGGNRAWTGTGVGNFPPLIAAYGIDKFIPLENGDQWKYPDGGQDQPPNGDANATSSLLSYATWCKANNGKGIGAYRMSRDYNHVPPFYVSRSCIQIMNASGGGTGGTGVVFYQDYNYGGGVTQTLAKGTYTMAQLQAKGCANDWASSVKIPAGWTVKMYQHDNFQGTLWTLSSNNTAFGSLSPNANDQMSSLVIQ
jgi:hypothetical protein